MTERLRCQPRAGRWMMGGLVVILCAGVTAAAELTLKGEVYTEGAAAAATVRAWALGDAVVADQTLLAEPLAEAAQAPGSAFALRLDRKSVV